jgi:predicted HTH transcriptional regulator
MNTEELEILLEGQSENIILEFKADMAWNVQSLAKDILAMSNMPDGGDIVIGIDDKTNSRQGVSIANIETFNYDIMKDQMSSFADPFVEFNIYFPKDSQDKDYVVIRIKSFREIPIICRRNGTEVRGGVVYYRNTNGRPQSSPISNSNDMRDIIELAAVRMMRRKNKIGFTVLDSDKELLDNELQEL